MMRRIELSALLVCLGISLPCLVQSQENDADATLSQAEAALTAELEVELKILSELRARIAEEKPPLAKKMNELAAQLREKQRSYDIARSTREAVSDEFEKAEKQLKLWRDERNYIDGLLLDFRKNFEAQSSLARNASLKEQFDAANTMDDDGTTARLELAREMINRIAESGTVSVLKGEALDPEGTLRPGTFAEAGPVSWFISDSGDIAGLISTAEGLAPEVLQGTADGGEIRKLVEGQTASPRFDPTLGTAVAIEESNDNLVEHILKGGVWIYPILFLALLSLLAAIVKWVQIIRIRDLRSGTVQEVIDAVRESKPEKAKESLQPVHHPAADILRVGVDSVNKSREDLEETLYETYLTKLPSLQRGLPLIAIAAATAPLLGLLGTVTGMIHTFQKITVFGTGDAKPLASGISEALVTTEFGLIVAIPSLIIHALLSRKTQGIRSTMEMSSLAFLNGVKNS